MNARLRSAALLLFLFLLAWIPRVVALDAYVSPDERKWLARSANFYYALSHGDLAHTFQREHPGVTVMWAGTLGLLTTFPDYPNQAPGYFTWEREHFEAWLQASTIFTPLELLVAGRWWVATGVALALWLGIFPLRRLLGPKAAYLAFAFLALSPFGVALSRQLHPDGFVASLTFLALLYLLAWLYAGMRWRDLILSGAVMGLAWLTKTPAALLAPVGALLVGVETWRVWRSSHRSGAAGLDPTAGKQIQTPIAHSVSRSDVRSLVVGFLLWGTVATIVFFLLWPAMWASPTGSLSRMVTEMEAYVEGHVNPNFFWGEPTSDPGWLFYPVAYLFRTTPGVMVGLLAAAFFWFRRDGLFASTRTRQTLFGLMLFAAAFFIAMTVPAKKFDRYLLPAFLALEVIAATGWLALGYLPSKGNPPAWLRRLRSIPPLALSLIALIVLHGLFTVATYPYYLTYFNPLVGGSRSAPQVLFVGWGEGLDAAARWLNDGPDARRLRVAAWYADGPFSYYFDGQSVPMGYSSPLSWLATDFMVTYVNQWQRQLPSPEAIDWFAEQTPVHVVDADGLNLARIYDLRQTSLPPFIDLNTVGAADFGGKIRLAGLQVDRYTVLPGDRLLLTFYLQALAKMNVNYNVLVRLVAADGSEVWRDEGWPWGAPTTEWPLREVRPDGHTLAIPDDIVPGLHQLRISFYDPTDLTTLPPVSVRTGEPLAEDSQIAALLQVGEPAKVAVQFDRPWRFENLFVLSGASLPSQANKGETVAVDLQWDALATTPTDYTTFVHLVDADGSTVAQMDQPPRGGFAPTHAWRKGQRLVDSVAIELPTDLPAGGYEIHVGLYAADARLPVSRDGASLGDYAAVGRIEVE